ncbi:MAG: hypothetical protein ABR589_04670 [Chthoniobacterales bacterium]
MVKPYWMGGEYAMEAVLQLVVKQAGTWLWAEERNFAHYAS